MQNTPQGYFMIIAYAILFIGVLIAGLGWFLFKLRALSNRPAWDGIGGRLMKIGLTMVVIGIILVAIALIFLGK